ncbi:hypothetical protein PENTCL1PPCAC_495, partial [Pristionchus entomophagus]
MRLLASSVLCVVLLQLISADPLCEQYLKCQEAVKTKQAECPHGAGKRGKEAISSNITACEEASAKQQELRDIVEKKVEEEHTCIAEASSKTTDKPAVVKGKCAKLSSRLTAGEALFGVATKKKGGKKEKKEGANEEKAARSECNRSLHALRQECRVLHKCCGAAAECAPKLNLAENDELRAKKKEVKDALKKCKVAAKAEKKQRKQEKKEKKEKKKGKKEEEKKAEEEKE